MSNTRDTRDTRDTTDDPINAPSHYRCHPSGVECIEITEAADFCIGNALKYIWRATWGAKDGADPAEDLRKACWYLQRKIAKLESEETFK